MFRRKFETRMKNTAVEILVDISGSMGGSKMQTAAYTSFALAKMLQRVEIPTEVMTFSTDADRGEYAKERREAELRLGRPFSQQDVCSHLLLKGFNERITPDVSYRFAHLGANMYRKMWNNCDPESVEVAARRLARRPEERRILMVLSDGQPAFEGDMYAAKNA